MTFIELMQVYTGSDGDATKALYERLKAFGPAGIVATNLFRACKASERAKQYRGGGYRGMAYDKKSWSIGNLSAALRDHAGPLGITWGWQKDPRTVNFEDVIYISLPTGQVSFHNNGRFDGPQYLGKWDEVRGQGPTRICQWIKTVLEQEEVANG